MISLFRRLLKGVKDMEYKGIDVSKWQGLINWDKVKKSGVEFAIIREGYGKKNPSQIDKKFKENINGAKNTGINVGVYHYSYADSINDAINEAQFCLENIQGYQLEYPVVFDIEDKEMLKLSTRQRTDICKAFCREIEKNGYYTMIYTNPNWLKNYLYSSELLSFWDLWLAQWDVERPSYSCGIWQYSETGKVDGISGNVDLNISYKDYPDIIKKARLNGFNSSNQSEQKYFNYTIKKGDTLWSLAQKYLGSGARYKEIKALNNLTSDTIYAGQVLKIPR